jgi:hypothetical protein
MREQIKNKWLELSKTGNRFMDDKHPLLNFYRNVVQLTAILITEDTLEGLEELLTHIEENMLVVQHYPDFEQQLFLYSDLYQTFNEMIADLVEYEYYEEAQLVHDLKIKYTPDE